MRNVLAIHPEMVWCKAYAACYFVSSFAIAHWHRAGRAETRGSFGRQRWLLILLLTSCDELFPRGLRVVGDRLSGAGNAVIGHLVKCR